MERREAQNVAKFVETQSQLRLEHTEETLANLIASRVRQSGGEPLNNIMCLVTPYQLHQAFKALPVSKAKGQDGVTKADYTKDLNRNIQNLYRKMLRMSYRPGPAREVLIPKMDGNKRPIAISNFEDKIVQKVFADILSALFEPLFKRYSFGFRPKRSCHGALSYLHERLRKHKTRWVVDVDLKNFFNTIDHEHLMKILEKKISDKRFLQYLRRMLKSQILRETAAVANDTGTPQGSIVSPILANIFLHEVLDLWFEENFGRSGRGHLVRYADDFVVTFKTKSLAQSFVRKLKKRLAEFSLELNEDKTKLVHFDRTRKGSEPLNFLGFTLYWGWSRIRKDVTLKVKTNNKTLAKKIQAYRHWIKQNRNRWNTRVLWEKTDEILRGHFQYFGISGNIKGLQRFYNAVRNALFFWLNRRSQLQSYSWTGFKQSLNQRTLPLPKRGMPLIELSNARLRYV